MALLTQGAIMNAFTAMLEEMPFDKITVTALVRRAGVSSNTFYYHYDDIYAVAEDYENELMEALSAALAELNRNAAARPLQFEQYAQRIIAVLKENEEDYRMVMRAASPRLFVERLKRIIARQIDENAAFLPLDPDPTRRQVQLCFLCSACVDVVVEYFYGNLSASLDTVTEVICDAIHKLERPL